MDKKLLIIIFAIALFLRVYNLSNFPVGFQIDEASLGYNGYSLLLTGKDDNNHRFPLYIDIFGDNRPSGYHYLTMLPIKFFGLTQFATRLPGALFGSISVFAIFFLAFVIFKNQKISLLAALCLAIAPWHVVLSRASAETIIALFFILTGFAYLFRGLENGRRSDVFFATIFLAFSYFFYHTPRVFVPLLFLIVVTALVRFLGKSKILQIKLALVSSFLFLLLLSGLLVFIISGGTGRFSQVNIFGFPETRLVLAEQTREDGVSGVNVFTTRVFHNKVVNYSLTFLSNYLDYFTGQFLFIKGGLPIWYQIPNMGLVYIVELPFILWGIFLAFRDKKNMYYKIPLLWLLVGPVTAAVTVDDIPNMQRAIVMFPMLEILCAFGTYHFIQKDIKVVRLFFIPLVGFLLVFNLAYFLHQYFVHAKVHRTWYRSNGFREMMQEVKQSYDKYDSIVMSKGGGGVYPLVLFYMRYDPALYQAQGSPKDKEYTGFGKFFFVSQDCPLLDRDGRFPKAGKIMYINQATCQVPKEAQYKDIYREDGTKAFRIVYEE